MGPAPALSSSTLGLQKGEPILLLRSKVLVAFLALITAALLIGVGLSARTASPTAANPLTGFVAMSAGDGFTCGRMSDASLKCWGINNDGQLGYIGADSTIPATVSLSAGVARQESSLISTCAVETGGGVECWGYSGPFLLIGTTPSTPSGLGSGIASVSVAFHHACVVTTGGGAKCWGENSWGELGNGSTVYAPAAVDVSGLTSGVAAIATGLQAHTCALTTSGGVKCWGDNSAGQLGAVSGETCVDFSVCSTTPLDVVGLSSGVAAIDLGQAYSCALMIAGDVKCWGFGFGPTPVTVAGLASGVAQISAGPYHLCARMTAGGIKCRGENTFGQLGDGTTTPRTIAVDVLGLGGSAIDISSGTYHSCAVLSSGQAKCWGFNGAGGLGNATSSGYLPNPVPIDVVIATQKPTPTPTPCGPGGCPTVTPTPTTQPTSGVGFSLGIDMNGDNVNDCGTRPGEPAKCSIPVGAQFQVRLFLNSLPVGVPQYGGYDAHTLFQGVTTKHIVQFTDWPGCSLAAGPVYLPGVVAFGCIVGVGAPNSSYLGLMARMTFTCAASGSVSLLHGQGDTELVSPDLTQYTEGDNTEESLAVNCMTAPPSTPTPTPHAVGGVALDPTAEDGGSALWLLLAACAAFALVASASVAMRRATRG